MTVTAEITDPVPQHRPFTCEADFGDGSPLVAGAVLGTSCSATHTYRTYGQYTVTVTATDALGSAGSASVTHAVIFAFAGPYPPLKGTASTSNAGSAIPVKFSLGGDKGKNIFLTGSPGVTLCSGGPSVPAVGDLAYSSVAGQYVFTWKTAKAWAGTCRLLSVSLIDGTTHTVPVTFR